MPVYNGVATDFSVANLQKFCCEIYKEYVREYQHDNEHSGEIPMLNSDDVCRNGKDSSSLFEFSSNEKSFENA